MTRERFAAALNSLPFVRWDRCTIFPVEDEDDPGMTAFGWIDRDDGRYDFVVVENYPWMEGFSFSTSSAKHSRAIGLALNGSESVHHDCERVEDVFPSVTNAIRLEASS